MRPSECELDLETHCCVGTTSCPASCRLASYAVNLTDELSADGSGSLSDGSGSFFDGSGSAVERRGTCHCELCRPPYPDSYHARCPHGFRHVPYLNGSADYYTCVEIPCVEHSTAFPGPHNDSAADNRTRFSDPNVRRCVCDEGYNGHIVWDFARDFWDGLCAAVDCGEVVVLNGVSHGLQLQSLWRIPSAAVS